MVNGRVIIFCIIVGIVFAKINAAETARIDCGLEIGERALTAVNSQTIMNYYTEERNGQVINFSETNAARRGTYQSEQVLEKCLQSRDCSEDFLLRPFRTLYRQG